MPPQNTLVAGVWSSYPKLNPNSRRLNPNSRRLNPNYRVVQEERLLCTSARPFSARGSSEGLVVLVEF